jgi:multidrug efflux system membrane fusion protein
MRHDTAKIVSRAFLQSRRQKLGLLLSAALLLSACSGESQETSAGVPKSVNVIQPQTAAITRYLYQTGTTKALESVDLTARVTGYLKSIDYRDGAEVKAGQRLFLIDPEQYEAQVRQAQAAAEQAKASLDNAQVQLNRQEELVHSSTTTQANVDNARATRDTSKAQLDSAEASLQEAQINLGYTNITAPFDGFVTEHKADVGALVGSGSPTTLATIVKLDPIHVSFSISDTDMLQIRKQMRERGLTEKDLQNVSVEAATSVDESFPYQGRLDYVAPQTDAATGTLSVRALFDNKNRDLLPNLFVRLRIAMGVAKDGLLVPPSAIGTDQQGRFVLAVNNDGIVERRSVSVLERSGDLQQVAGALSAEDWIAQNALSNVNAGEKVSKEPTRSPGGGAASARLRTVAPSAN